MASKYPRTLWATTRYKHRKVSIYRVTDPKFTYLTDGECRPPLASGEVEIWIADHVFDSAKFDETLWHEFVHCMEWCEPAAAFSPKQVGDCTRLAQTVGAGFGELLGNLWQEEQPRKRARKKG